MKTLPATLAALALLLVSTAPAPAQGFGLGEVLVVNLPDLRPGADTAAFERFVLDRVVPASDRAAPGMKMSLLKAERGSRAGQHMLVWNADRETRERYAPVPAASGAPFSAEMLASVGDVHQGFEPFVNSEGSFLEYHLLSPEAVGPLPTVDILGIHYIQVRPDRREEFERFVAGTIHPAVGNLRPDLRLLTYRSVRGQDAGSYITIYALTNASRDKYWPGGADSAELQAAFAPEIRALADQLKAYLVEGTYGGDQLVASAFESRVFADYLHLPAAP